MFDTAEAYAGGKSEEEMWILILLYIEFVIHAHWHLHL